MLNDVLGLFEDFTPKHSRRYAELGSLGLPLLIGASRKSFLGGAPEDRLPATLAVTERAARAGVLFVRVHDIAENLAAIRRAEEKK